MVNDPLFVPEILKHVGPVAFVDWFVHFVGLGSYTALTFALGDCKFPFRDMRCCMLWVCVIRHAAPCYDAYTHMLAQACSWQLTRS